MAHNKLSVEGTIIGCSLAATSQISEELSLNNESRKWLLLEILGVLIYYANRRAFAIGGPALRATIQDAITPNCVQGVIETSKQVPEFATFDDEGAFEQIETCIDYIELEYSSCKNLTTDSNADFLTDNSMLGKLAGRVTGRPGIDDPVGSRLFVYLTMGELMSELGLAAAIDRVCVILSRSSDPGVGFWSRLMRAWKGNA